MAKILDDSSIGSTIPKMLELPDSFIINGQVHDKLTMEPKKFKTIVVPTLAPKLFRL